MAKLTADEVQRQKDQKMKDAEQPYSGPYVTLSHEEAMALMKVNTIKVSMTPVYVSIRKKCERARDADPVFRTPHD